MTLAEQLKSALAKCELYDADIWEGGVYSAVCLQPILAALCECAEALEAARPLTDLTDVSDALARLESALAQMKGK